MLPLQQNNEVLPKFRLLKSNKKVISDFFIFFLSKWLSHINVTCKSQKNENNCLNIAFVAQKPLFEPFLPILVNFGWLSTLLKSKI